MRYVSLFSGIEAATVAWKDLDLEPVAFAEIEKFPCELLAKHYPNVPNLGDVTKINWNEFKDKYGTVELIVGGSPCQSFSIAGNRAGLQGESGLMFEYIRAVRELMPNFFLWENVPGALSVESGGAFRQLLCEMADCGYCLAWRVLDAQFFGVPQRRRRLFLVGSLGNTSAGEILFESESVSRYFDTSKQKREKLAERVRRSSERSYTLKLRHTGSTNVGGGEGPLIQDDVSATLATRQDQTLFAPVPYCKMKRAQNPSDYETWGRGEVSNTLNCFDVGETRANELVICAADDTANASIDNNVSGTLKVGGATPYICTNCKCFGFTRERIGAQVDEDLCQTIQAAAGTSGNNQPCVCVLNDQGGASINVEKDEISPTLRANTHQHEPVVVCKKGL